MSSCSSLTRKDGSETSACCSRTGLEKEWVRERTRSSLLPARKTAGSLFSPSDERMGGASKEARRVPKCAVPAMVTSSGRRARPPVALVVMETVPTKSPSPPGMHWIVAMVRGMEGCKTRPIPLSSERKSSVPSTPFSSLTKIFETTSGASVYDVTVTGRVAGEEREVRVPKESSRRSWCSPPRATTTSIGIVRATFSDRTCTYPQYVPEEEARNTTRARTRASPGGTRHRFCASGEKCPSSPSGMARCMKDSEV
mmetsp:Transcript_19591/g.58066  ORF Transcript_19591/g.58066 Transcript_19591/m.58066 type:complete len:255 (+) Transcript_19591:2359-3123(+)